MSLRIVADRNIAAVEEAFAPLGSVCALPSGELTREAVREADLFLCRSTVNVGPALLEGSRVRFVATATIGIDHLDRAWLGERGIRWASAPGSNADSVVQWLAATIAHLCEKLGRDPAQLQLGIVGVGQVGRRVERMARALGRAPLLCDPPRARAEGPGAFVTLDELLAHSDLVTLHVPLEREGPDATVRLLDERALARMKPGAILVNASRGEVVHGDALKDALAKGRLAAAALDVFEREPSPDPALVAACTVATPHIAGHSLDGKLNGTRMVYEAACRFLGVPATWRPSLAPAPPLPLASTLPTASLVLAALAARYSVDADDGALRAAVSAPDAAARFRAYRQAYPERRELASTPLALAPADAALDARLRSLSGDFRVLT